MSKIFSPPTHLSNTPYKRIIKTPFDLYDDEIRIMHTLSIQNPRKNLEFILQIIFQESHIGIDIEINELDFQSLLRRRIVCLGLTNG